MSGPRITVAREALLPALALATRVIERRNTIPVLSNVMLKASGGSLTVSATDLDAEMTTRCACSGDAAWTTLPASNLHDIVRKLPEGCEVALTDEGASWTVAGGRARFKLHCLPPADMPLMSDAEFPHSFAIPAASLSVMLDTVRHAISSEETRYYLNGVYLHPIEDGEAAQLIAVTTDGHRLARHPLPLPEGAIGAAAVIVPRKTVELISKLLPEKGDVMLSISETRISVVLENGTSLTSKLIDGSYPDYRRVVPTANPNRFLVDRAALSAAVDRVTTISSSRGSAVKFAFGDELVLAATNPDAGSAEETVPVERIAGDSVETGFNGRYCFDMLAAIGSENIVFELGDAGSPALVRPQDGDDTRPSFVLMPMRV